MSTNNSHPLYSINDKLKALHFNNLEEVNDRLKKQNQSLQDEIFQLKQELANAKRDIAFHEYCDELDWNPNTKKE